MRNNVSDIYRYLFSSFESDLYPAPGSRSYIFRRTAVRNKQQATTLLQVTLLILACPSQPLILPFATENRNWKRDSCVVSQSSGPRGLLIELLETGIRALPRGAILPSVSRCPSYRYAVVLFKGEPIGESILAHAFIRSINISNTLAILSYPAHVR